MVLGASGSILRSEIGKADGVVGIDAAGNIRLEGNPLTSDVILSLNTADGADNKALQIGGGGDAGAHRGAYINLYGNEYPSGAAGQAHLLSGTNFDIKLISSGAGKTVLIPGTDSATSVSFQQADGTEYFHANSLTKTIYMDNVVVGSAGSATTFTASYFVSTVAIGTSPYQCTSTTVNTNLNADLWDGQHLPALAAGQFLTNNGSTLSWAAVTVTAAGSDTQIQFNDGGVIGADADFTWNKTTNTLTVNSLTITNNTITAPAELDILAGGSGGNKNVRIKSSGTGIVLLYPGADSTNAVRIMNAAGTTNIIYADTTNSFAYIPVHSAFGTASGSTSYLINAAKTFTGTTGGQVGLNFVMNTPISTNGQTDIGLTMGVNATHTANTTALLVALDFAAYVASANAFNFGQLTGFRGTCAHAGTATLTTGRGGNTFVSNTSTGTITNAECFRIGLIVNTGGGTIVNAYGLYIRNQSAGSTLNYNIYVDSDTAINDLGGQTRCKELVVDGDVGGIAGCTSLTNATTTGANTGTLTNCPVTGNPATYIKIYIGTTARYIPAW